jgi:uncharacterized protein (DUF342 family)
MVVNKPYNTVIEAAQGLAPLPGTPGKFEILIDVSGKGKPRKLADGRVDHRDISYVVNITKGTPILRHIPPVQGNPGLTVFNNPVDPLPVVDMPLVAGKGAIISPRDAEVLIADTNGAIVVHADGAIEVVDNKVVNGNIDYSTGSIKFSGNLRVTGTVRGGFEIDVEGDCRIGGNVEDAKIICRGDLEINGGAIGSSKGTLKCGGSMKVKHIANFNAQAGEDIIIMEDALHCIMSAQGNIKVKNIIGGITAAWKKVETECIGTEAEPKTIIDLGGRYLLTQKKHALLKELTVLTGDIGSIRERIFVLARDEMDAGGILPAGPLNRLDALKTEHRIKRDSCVKIQADIEVLDAKLNQTVTPTIQARTIHPNVIIKFGSVEKIIREKIGLTRISIDGEKIVIGKL